MLDLQQTLTRLNAAGVTLRARGGRLTVESREALTESQRLWIRAHKGELLRVLGGDARPPRCGLAPDDRAAISEAIEERAAIREHDGGEPKEVAEQQARAAMRVYRVLVAMGESEPPRWLTMLAPVCDLAETDRTARLQFGADRVLELVEHRGVLG